jgi:hypothetical protein
MWDHAGLGPQLDHLPLLEWLKTTFADPEEDSEAMDMWDHAGLGPQLDRLPLLERLRTTFADPEEDDASMVDTIYQWLRPAPGHWARHNWCDPRTGAKNKYVLEDEENSRIISKWSIIEGIETLEADIYEPATIEDENNALKRIQKRRQRDCPLESTNTTSMSKKKSRHK